MSDPALTFRARARESELIKMSSCFRCGRAGHQSHACTAPPGTKPTCRRCGKRGHLREHCPSWSPCENGTYLCERVTLERYNGVTCPCCGYPRPDDPCRHHEHTAAQQQEINERGAAKVAAARRGDFAELERLAAIRH